MKHYLLSAGMGIAMLSFATSALAETGTVLASSGNSSNEYPLSCNIAYAGSECLYTSAQLEAATGGLDTFTITELQYLQDNIKSYSVELKVYYAVTDKTNLSTGLNESEMTEVFNGAISDNETTDLFSIKLDKPITLHKGENLVIGILSHAVEPAYVYFCYGSVGSSMARVYTDYSNPVSLTATGGDLYSYPAALNIVYSEGEGGDIPVEPDTFDMSALSIAGATTVSADIPYKYTVNVKNEGNQTVENYSVGVYSVGETGVETQLGITENCDALIKGMSNSVEVDVVFPESGTYNVVGKVIYTEDQDNSNNTTSPITVEAVSIDIKPGTLQAPSTAQLGEDFEVNMQVENKGDKANGSYSVAIERVDNNDEVLSEIATITDVPEIGANSTATLNIPVTFELAGEYRLRGVVKVEGMDDAYTNVATVEVTYDKLPGVHDITVPSTGSSAVTWNAINRGNEKYVAEYLYAASYFDNLERGAQVQKIGFTAVDNDYPVSIPTKIYAASVSNTSISKTSIVPFDKFTLVYDGVIKTTGSGTEETVSVEFGNSFMLNQGESLALYVECIGETSGWTPMWRAINTENPSTVKSSIDNQNLVETFTLFNASDMKQLSQVPLLSMEYAYEPLPDMCDMAITSFTVPTTCDQGLEATFRADVKNEGTVEVDSYILQLLDVTDEENPIVLAESYVDNSLGAGGEAYNQKVKYTFQDYGTFTVAMRVEASGDLNEANNMSEKLTLIVNKNTGVTTIVNSEDQLAYKDGILMLPATCVAYQVADMSGRVLTASAAEGSTTAAIALAKGIYVATAVKADGSKLTLKINVK